MLFVGDLSYADQYPNNDNVRWDTWGRFVERSVAYQPWIWTAGNHEIDFAPKIVSVLQNCCVFLEHSALNHIMCGIQTKISVLSDNCQHFMLTINCPISTNLKKVEPQP